jgi:hypothetical protein
VKIPNVQLYQSGQSKGFASAHGPTRGEVMIAKFINGAPSHHIDRVWAAGVTTPRRRMAGIDTLRVSDNHRMRHSFVESRTLDGMNDFRENIGGEQESDKDHEFIDGVHLGDKMGLYV